MKNERVAKGRPPFEHQHNGKGHYLTWSLVIVAVFAISFGFGHLLATFIYRYTGEPPAVVMSIIAGVIGILLVVIISKTFIALYRRTTKEEFIHQGRVRMLEDTIAAMERISRGDFSVLVETNEHEPFSELAESVNKMARELGSMENLRQDFISNVSHEIQSPLTSISGFAALLKNRDITPEKRTHYLDIIETEAKRLSKLSDNLLKLSSLENDAQALTTAEFKLDKQIKDTVLMLEPQWTAKNLGLSLSLDKVDFTGDESLLSQVWINLLHNAIKFTPENGEIEVSLSEDGMDAVFRVSDTGQGISTEDQLRIFERFYKADKARDRSLGGNGLGLSLAQKIVDLHGGTIAVESEVDKGSTFTVSLPFKK